jgi:hypothetical protein
MANNYTPEEIQEVFDEYHRNLSNGIPITKDLAERMRDATTGVKNYTYQLNQSFKQLGSSIKTLSTDIAKGAEGASVFSNSVDSTADVVSNFASKFGVVGAVLGGVAKAGAAYIGAVNKQSDALYKSFQDISKTGTLGAGGMNEVFTSMQKFGYAVDELGQMQSLLAENSRTLADFGGTAFRGARQLSNLADNLQRGDLGERFRNMGQSVDDINRNAAGYIKSQVALGRQRTDIERNLTIETSKYIEQIVAVQKLTGQSREQLEEKEAQAQREQAFAYTQYQLKKRADAGDVAAERKFQKNRLLNQVLEGKARDQFIAGVGGDIGAMGNLIRTAPEFVQKALDDSSAEEAYDALAKGVNRSVDSLGGLARFNAYDDFALPMGESLKLITSASEGTMAERLAAAKKEAETTDKATQDQTKMRMSQMNARQSMENFVNAGVDPVTKAMKILAYTVEWLTDLLPGSSRARAKYEKEQEQTAKTAAKLTGGVLEKIIQVESGGRNIGTTGSSAFGIGQMTKGTFEGLAKNAAPSSALYGKSFDDMKSDVGLQREALAQLTMQNQSRLAGAGLGTDDASTYLAHFLGSSGAIRVLSANDSTPIDKVVDGRSLNANPNVFKNMQTAGDLKAWAANKMQSAAPVTGGTPGASGAFGFNGSISGPMSGYRPNLLMHGTEQISIKPAMSNMAENTSSGAVSSDEMLSKMDDLISLAKSQLYVNEKLLRYQS